MRSPHISPNEYYHVYNRGVNRATTFTDVEDFARFIFLITHFQSLIEFKKPGRSLPFFITNGIFETSDQSVKEIVNRRTVELVAFTLMTNHFHLILKESRGGGIANFMGRVLNSYTKYFNTRYKRTGHLFEGPYKAVRVKNNNQLLHLSAYVHKNPRDIPLWRDRELAYPYGSYQDFVKRNRFGKLLSHEIVTEQFQDEISYKKFVDGSSLRKWGRELGSVHLFD